MERTGTDYGCICCLQGYTGQDEGPVPDWSSGTGPDRESSTFIRRFLEVLALPAMEDNAKAEVRDQLPLSGSGTLITTVEPKFIPKEAVKLSLGEDIPIHLRLIDCVGFLVPDATGNIENEKERMVKTPWFEEAIPFHQAAEIGTRKVISEHSTLGLVVTTDGSFGEIPRNNFLDAEAKTVAELKKQGKPLPDSSQFSETL